MCAFTVSKYGNLTKGINLDFLPLMRPSSGEANIEWKMFVMFVVERTIIDIVDMKRLIWYGVLHHVEILLVHLVE